MDGVSFNRSISRSAAPAGGYAPSANDSLDAIRQDALRLSGGQPGPAPAQIAGGVGNPSAVSQRVQADAQAALQAGDRVKAQMLINFAGVLDGLGNDPEAAGALAQAYTNPNGSEASRRLAATFLANDPNPTSCLLGLVSFDGPSGAQWRANYPQNGLSGGVTGTALAGDLIKQIADPTKVNQGNRQTCGAASTQILLAREAPAELIRLATSLAVNGQAQLRGGDMIQRQANWDFRGDGTRTVTGRLLQPAFMDYANGGATYDNTADKSADGTGQREGLLANEMQRLLAGVTTRKTEEVQYKNFNGGWANMSAEDPLARIAQSTAKGWSVPVLMWLQPNQAYGHYEMVKTVTDSTVTLINPWGYEENIPVDQFRQRVVAAFYQ
ncbi:MAG: hypothetical protein JWM80_606 [Cyanobacteria bacterium RYN_339]|nr:hypothetical protein [Cyanobacteria bacterium RYN_339]